jgi:hypothetical protein
MGGAAQEQILQLPRVLMEANDFLGSVSKRLNFYRVFW